MNPLQLLVIARAHYIVVLVMVTLSLSIALAINFWLPKQYTASTAVLVDVKSPDPVATMIMASSTLGTQIDIINSDRVARKVVRTMGMDTSPLVREQWLSSTGGKGSQETWLAELLLKGIKVTPARDSMVLNIAYTGTDPAFTAEVVNGFAQAYIDVSIELKVDPARQYARWFGEQGKSLRESLEKAQAKLSSFQQEKGIVTRDERGDVESVKLSELTSQLVRIQAETNEARSKLKSSKSGAPIAEVVTNPTVANLRSEIATQEARLKDTANNLGKNHPNYLRAQSELVSLKQKLETETQLITSGLTTSTSMAMDREADVKAAIALQKKKLLEIKTDRDQLAVLQRDVDIAQNAYDTVTRRYTDSTLQSQTTQANVSVVSVASVPLIPSFPKPLDKTLAIAIVLGVVLGGGAAFGVEMLNRRIRSVDDLAAALQLPVLGVITRAKLGFRARTAHRLAFWRRAAVPAAVPAKR
jgi:polysaccharide biosynthesis transport protein